MNASTSGWSCQTPREGIWPLITLPQSRLAGAGAPDCPVILSTLVPNFRTGSFVLAQFPRGTAFAIKVEQLEYFLRKLTVRIQRRRYDDADSAERTTREAAREIESAGVLCTNRPPHS
jgi:hypothetical protein